jgi:uncharacterized membrane protein
LQTAAHTPSPWRRPVSAATLWMRGGIRAVIYPVLNGIAAIGSAAARSVLIARASFVAAREDQYCAGTQNQNQLLHTIRGGLH